MGYLVSAHFLKHPPSRAAVSAALPPSIGFTLYVHAAVPLYAVDTYRASKPPQYPFSKATPATDLSLDIPQSLPGLSEIYEELLGAQMANGLKRAYINLSLMLAKATERDVLSIYSDDDGNDFACHARPEGVVSGAARCGAYLVRFGSSGASKSAAGADSQLHRVASEALEQFGVSAPALGLGDIDPPEDYGFRPMQAA